MAQGEQCDQREIRKRVLWTDGWEETSAERDQSRKGGVRRFVCQEFEVSSGEFLRVVAEWGGNVSFRGTLLRLHFLSRPCKHYFGVLFQCNGISQGVRVPPSSRGVSIVGGLRWPGDLVEGFSRLWPDFTGVFPVHHLRGKSCLGLERDAS